MSRTRHITVLYDAVEDDPQPDDADQPVYRQVVAALRERGHRVNTLAARHDLTELVRALEADDSEIVFNLCEGLGGLDVYATHVASLLELVGKPFTGAGSFGLSLAQDKALAKKLFAFHGLQSPRFSLMQAGKVEWSDELQFPLFVKPSASDSSVGIDAGALVHDLKSLMERISYIHTDLKSAVLIEEFIDGRELFVGVLGSENMHALPIVEWDFSEVKGPKFATQEAKWDKNSEGYRAPEVFPTDIPPAVYAAIQRAAIDACQALRIFDYGRVDMRVRCKQESGVDKLAVEDPQNWEIHIIEVNPNPYLEQNAEVAMAAKKNGLSYGDLIEHIIEATEMRTIREQDRTPRPATQAAATT
jgi:D-alanine-D-alanine ligase